MEIKYIKGSKNCPERVIKTLLNMGARNPLGYCRDNNEILYYVQSGIVYSARKDSVTYELLSTHPDWKEIFPEILTWNDVKKSDLMGKPWRCDSANIVSQLQHDTPIRLTPQLHYTEKQVKSSLAMSKISWLCNNQIETRLNMCVYHFLAFHTVKQRDKFLKYNRQLVKDYLIL